MAKRKRAPGGGRKPEGATVASSALNVRIEPALRQALEEEVRSRGAKSVSGVVVKFIQQGLTKKTSTAQHNALLGATVALMAELVEKQMGRSWRADPFTQQVLLAGIHNILVRYMPGIGVKKPEIPSAPAELIAKSPPQFQTPDGLGFAFSSILLNEIEQAASNPMPSEMTQPIFFSERPAQLALIGRGLSNLSMNVKPKGKRK